MAVKPNNEDATPAANNGDTSAALKKTNNLVAVAVGLAGASILLTAGTAFAGTFDHKGPERDREHSQVEQQSQESQMQMRDSEGGEREQERERKGMNGGKGQHALQQDGETSETHEGMMNKMHSSDGAVN